MELALLFTIQLVNRFIFLRDTGDLFALAVCQAQLSQALPESVVSTENMQVWIFACLK